MTRNSRRPEPSRDRGERYRVPAGVRHTGGGAFDPSEENIYFLASQTQYLGMASEYHDHLLIAVNEVESEAAVKCLEDWIAQGKRVFLDSGVFNLSTSHAQAHGLSMDQALGLAPDQVDGFAELFDRYVSLVRRLGDGLWGYIEIDQGGRENKLKTRARLEALGLRPIPVYHPLNDGWDYFDHLATHYDRICFGNVVQATTLVRKRLLATAWERHRRYPHVWIHLLGLTPNQWLNALPMNSGDSSAWLSPVRWSNNYPNRADGADFGTLPRDWRYVPTSVRPDATWEKAGRVCAYGSHMNLLNQRRHLQDLEALGCHPYPPPAEEDPRGNV